MKIILICMILSIFLSIVLRRQSVAISRYKQETTKVQTSQRNQVEDKNDEVQYHVVFSTDCSAYQHWQSYLLFYSALKVRQPGHVTRIASGCNEDEALAAIEWHEKHIKQTMSDRFELHLTPEFSSIAQKKGEIYEYFNKPFGLLHWLEHGESIRIDGGLESQIDEDAVIILIDPDTVLLRPIGIDFSNDKEVILHGKGGKHRVEHGTPFAQVYGYRDGWMEHNLTHIVEHDSPALQVTLEEAITRYPAGPPYIVTAKDMHTIALKWTELAPKVYYQLPSLMAEMYAYSIAAAHLQLPHQLVESLMVSFSGEDKEAWPYIDDIPAEDVCDFAFHMNHSQHHPLPNVLHYCQDYIVGDWFFEKRRFPQSFFSCQSPLLAIPPMDIALKYDYRLPPPPHKPAGEKKPMSREMAKRESFVLCGMISSLNEAGEYFKKNHCNGADETRRDKSLELWKVPY